MSFTSLAEDTPRYLIPLIQLQVRLFSYILFLQVCFYIYKCNRFLNINFHVFILYPSTLLNSFLSINLLESVVFSQNSVMPSANRGNFTSSLPIWVSFVSFSHLISFSFLISVARTYSTMWNKCWESGHPCLVPETMVLVDDPFNTFFNLVCLCFVQYCCIYIHQGHWAIIFYFSSFSHFDVSIMLAL